MKRLVLLLALLLARPLPAQQRTTSPHGDLKLDCTACHQSNSWTSIQVSRQFDHGRYGFPLTGAHGVTACRACHVSLDFKQASASCSSCHTDNHNGEFGGSCARCHNTRSFVDRDAMGKAHQLTRFTLTGSHLAVDCTACHRPTSKGQLQYVGTPTTCISCHQADYNTAPNHLTSRFPTTCEGCHNTATWTAAGMGGNHPVSPIALTGVHSANLIACTQCHTSMPYATVKQTCDGCHHAEYVATTNPNHAAAGYGTTCTQCHQLVANWAGATFNHPASPIALTGVHSANLLTCTQCHTSMPYSTVTQTCDGCHHAEYVATTNPNHTAAGYGTTCTQCHQLVANWAGASVNHPTSPIALTGVHSSTAVQCAQCHVTMPYASVKQTCDGCHHADFTTPTDPNHVTAAFAVTCTDCHALVAGWTGARFTAHDGSVSQFRIYSGKHLNRWSNCSECHKQGQPYSATPQLLCLNCHAQVQTDQHRGQNYTPSDCVRSGCHANGSKP